MPKASEFKTAATNEAQTNALQDFLFEKCKSDEARKVIHLLLTATKGLSESVTFKLSPNMPKINQEIFDIMRSLAPNGARSNEYQATMLNHNISGNIFAGAFAKHNCDRHTTYDPEKSYVQLWFTTDDKLTYSRQPDPKIKAKHIDMTDLKATTLPTTPPPPQSDGQDMNPDTPQHK